MREVIKKLLRETLLKESYGPFKDSTMVPDYEKLKNGNYDELPSYYRDMHAEIVYMSPKEYLALCAKLQGTSYEEQFNIVNGPNGLSKVNKLIDLIDSGVNLNMPYLNFVNGYISQEGRHRAKAAMDLGYAKIPVLVIEDKERESDISLSSKFGVWKDLTKNDYGYMVSFNLNDFREQIKLLNCVSRNFEEYLLGPILNFYQYSNLYKEGLISIVKKENKDFHTMNNMSEYEIHDLISELPDEYKKLLLINYNNASDEEIEEWDNKIKELIKPLMDLGMLFILEHNKYLLSEIFEYDYKTKIGYLLINEDIEVYDDYSSAKDMLLNIKYYDDIKFYSYENGDLDKMNKSFIQKYKELLPETLGGVRIR
jgi:hypothetical protein